MAGRPRRISTAPARFGYEEEEEKEKKKKRKTSAKKQEEHKERKGKSKEKSTTAANNKNNNSNNRNKNKKRRDEYEEDDDEEPLAKVEQKKKSKQTTTTATKKAKKSSKNWISAQKLQEIETAKEAFEVMSATQLKDLLRKNGQKMAGTKDAIVQRVAEGSILGAVPQCPSCGGGKLDFNIATGSYKCPGYFDDTDFVRCWKNFSYDEVNRLPWMN